MLNLRTLKIIAVISIVISAITLFWIGRSQIYNFVNIHFILPLGRSYNPVNSVVYAILLFAGIFLLSKVFLVLKVKIDVKFLVAIIPFILLGSCLRVFYDIKIFDSLFLVSPLIYFLIFAFALICLLLSLSISKRTHITYYLLLFILGTIPAAYFVVSLASQIVNVESIIFTVFFWLISCIIGYLTFLGLNRIYTFKKFAFDLSIIFSNMLDVSATFVGVTFYGYREQHFLVRLLTDIFGSLLIFYLVDFLVLVLVLYLLERILRDEETLLGLFRLTLFVLGLAPALRDILRVALLG